MNPCLRHGVSLRSPRPTARIHSLPGASPPGPPLSALSGLQTWAQPVHRPSYIHIRALHHHRMYSFTVPIYTMPYIVLSGALQIILWYDEQPLIRTVVDRNTAVNTNFNLIQLILTFNNSHFLKEFLVWNWSCSVLNFLLNAIFALSLIWYGIRSSHNCQHAIAIWPYTVYC